MFGYIKTDYPNLYVKDTVLYKAIYCGLCKGIGEATCQKGRFLLSYDLTFLSLLTHNVLDVDFNVQKSRCVLHQIVKKPMAKVDDLTLRISALNVILSRYKLNDNVLDSGKGRVKRVFFNRAYRFAKKREPILDEIVKKRYNELLTLERKKIDSVDIVSDPFSNMMKDIVKELCCENADENLLNLSYNLGKWVYLIDAVDDFEKDKKSGSYNVFVNLYKDCETKQQLLTENKESVEQIFNFIIGDIYEYSSKLKYKFNHDLIDNILLKGIPKETKKILRSKDAGVL